MDWHLIEVGLVTTLSIWVYLFSPSTLSRLAAAVMFLLNLVWVIFEKDRPQAGRTAPPVAGEAGPESTRPPAATGPTEDPPRSPRVI